MLWGDRYDEVIHIIVRCGCDVHSVDVEEYSCGEPAESLVAVDQGVVGPVPSLSQSLQRVGMYRHDPLRCVGHAISVRPSSDVRTHGLTGGVLKRNIFELGSFTKCVLFVIRQSKRHCH